MHAKNRPVDSDPNTWTPARSDVRWATDSVRKSMMAGTTPEADHLATLIRAAVAYIDAANHAESAPLDIRSRLERIERTQELTAPLTRAEVLGSIADLRTMVDLHTMPKPVPDEISQSTKDLVALVSDDPRSEVLKALQTLERGIFGTTTLPSSGLPSVSRSNKKDSLPILLVDEETFQAVTEGLWHALRVSGEDIPNAGETLILTSEQGKRLYLKVDRVEKNLIVFGRYPASHGQKHHGEEAAFDHLGIYD